MQAVTFVSNKCKHMSGDPEVFATFLSELRYFLSDRISERGMI